MHDVGGKGRQLLPNPSGDIRDNVWYALLSNGVSMADLALTKFHGWVDDLLSIARARPKGEPPDQMLVRTLEELASRGYVVFYPNIRGSTGYGHKFIASVRADWGGGDYKDVMAGVDYLVTHGIADPNRLGIGGWSYGGYMSSWVITQTNRFKAAVTGAGLADLAAEFGTENGSSYDEWFYGTPYEKPEGFARSSPITYIKNAHTPTLILQGDADVTDPIGQSQQLYRGLKRYGVETDFVIYPREGHGFREEKHLIDRLNRIISWYDAHLK